MIHKNGEIFDIVDGQQRLITLSLLLYYLNDQNKPSNKSLLDETVTHTVSENNIINNYNFIKIILFPIKINLKIIF